MRARWVLLANAARARLLDCDPDNGGLRELEDFVHPSSRLKPSALGHDQPGAGARGSQHPSFEPATGIAEREHVHFAQQLAAHLETAAHANRLPPWALLASSPFLGRLHAELGAGVAERLVWHLDRDLTALPLHELEPRLRQLLPPGPPQAPG